MWHHRRQPTRLPRPWDSPGKNTGVGTRGYFTLLMAETALALNARLLSCPLQSNFVRSWLLRTKWSIPNPMAHQLLKSSWLSAAKHFLFWVPVEGEAGVSLSPRPRKISLEIPAPLPVSSVRETPTWLSKSLFSVRLHQEIPSLWKPILIQSIVCKRGSNQVSEPVFPHGIFQLETFLPNC